MCGIVGILGQGSETVPLLMESLTRLEYRGYDSAGIATLDNGRLKRRRAKGKIAALREVLEAEPMAGHMGIGHTRWATHGGVNEDNAHPHMTEAVAIVHNGIIENYSELLQQLKAQNITMRSETDSEIIAHLLDEAYTEHGSGAAAMGAVCELLKGAFAFVALFKDEPDKLFGARYGSPLAIGFGESVSFGSDALAVAHMAHHICYLEDGDIAELATNGTCRITDSLAMPVERSRIPIADAAMTISKGNYRHYMLKEIYEQPTAFSQSLATLIDPETRQLITPDIAEALSTYRQICLVACGSSYYAGMLGKYRLDRWLSMPTQCAIASEFRSGAVGVNDKDLAIFLSQSGETMDSVAAMNYAKAQGAHSLAIANVDGSSMVRGADSHLLMHAGPEVGVAATKSFSAQLLIVSCLALSLGRVGGAPGVPDALSAPQERQHIEALMEVPALMNRVLDESETIHQVAAELLVSAKSALYLGRGDLYPIALEAALKLKELSYIHAEGYAAGELKHGPMALADESLPVIFLAPSGILFDKLLSNIREVAARGARVIVLSDAVGVEKIRASTDIAAAIVMPECDWFVAPLVYTVPVQLLAYYTALEKGTDIDQPRNLAKSVTVE